MSEVANTLLVNRAIIADKDRILLLRRSKSDLHNSNQWEFPGGKIDAGEEVADGLSREVFEETGLVIELLSPVAHVESEVIHTGRYAGRLYVALFYAARKLGGELALSDEHEAAIWDEPPRISRHELTPESRRALMSFRNLGII